ncbi:hypothetical protein IAT38_004730 [Cryptococcus sp. DSM 104549]
MSSTPVPAPKLQDVFKTHPDPSALASHLASSRIVAIKHLRHTIPDKVKRLTALVAAIKDDKESPLWKGHRENGAFLKPTFGQPKAEDGRVLPDDIVGAKNGGNEGADEVKLGKRWFEVLGKNTLVEESINILTVELDAIHEIMQDLKMWLDLEIPVIEDGNSFGADVQNSLIGQLAGALRYSSGTQSALRKESRDRLTLAKEWAQYPNFEGYADLITGCDRDLHYAIGGYLAVLLTIYGRIFTKFEKNWAKVIQPKGSNSGGGMY